MKPSTSTWVTALFVQFRFLEAESSRQSGALLDSLGARFEQIVNDLSGNVVALSRDAGFALFSGGGHPQTDTRNAVKTAERLMGEVERTNRQRMALDLCPIRLGIGITGGIEHDLACNRHPWLSPGIVSYMNRARQLSELNYQAPFPAMFISREVADSLNPAERDAVQSLGSVIVEDEVDPLAVYALLDG